ILISAASGEFDLYDKFISKKIAEEDYNKYSEKIRNKFPLYEFLFSSMINDAKLELHQKNSIRQANDDYFLLFFEIEKGINEIFKKYNNLTDEIVANVFTEQIFLKEKREYNIFYLDLKEELLHSKVKRYFLSLRLPAKFSEGSVLSVFSDIILKIKVYAAGSTEKNIYLNETSDFFKRSFNL
ncbi:MAG: hypothetical protein HQK51_12350, partial [Oligoflexia bacterium]|nr:hypothetical protein [Oligoflexia bacterium]